MKKQIILDTISDMISELLYYDRKEDEELGVGDIEQAIKDGVITVDEILTFIKDKIEAEVEDE